MQRRHAVDGHGPRQTQIGHADMAIPDDGQLGGLGRVVEIILHLLLPAVGDLLQDLPDAGQQRLKQLLRPDLQRLGQHRMVGVGHAVGDDVPRLVPVETRVVHQNTHQLRDHQRGVGVVDLNDVLLVEVLQGAVDLDMLAGDGLHGGGNEEVLLLQPQGLALVVVVLGVQHLADGVRHGTLLRRLQILALTEQLHVDGLGAAGLPQPQGIDVVGVVAGDLHVAGHGQHAGVVLMHHHQVAVVPAGANLAAEVDLLRLLQLGQQPCVAQLHPVVRQLHLLSLHDLLLEDAQLIADGVAGGGDVQRGHAVQIAGGQTAQTAVAQAGVRLDLKNIGGLEAQLVNGVGQRIQQLQIVGVLHETAAHQELHGQVMHLPPSLMEGLLPRLHAALGHDIPQHHGAGLHHLAVGGLLLGAAVIQPQLLDDRFLQCLLGIGHIQKSSV